jgi:hypothetical protein
MKFLAVLIFLSTSLNLFAFQHYSGAYVYYQPGPPTRQHRSSDQRTQGFDRGNCYGFKRRTRFSPGIGTRERYAYLYRSPRLYSISRQNQKSALSCKPLRRWIIPQIF